MMGNSGYPAYTTANGGITAMTRSLAREFGPDRIRLSVSSGRLDLLISDEELDSRRAA